MTEMMKKAETRAERVMTKEQMLVHGARRSYAYMLTGECR